MCDTMFEIATYYQDPSHMAGVQTTPPVRYPTIQDATIALISLMSESDDPYGAILEDGKRIYSVTATSIE